MMTFAPAVQLSTAPGVQTLFERPAFSSVPDVAPELRASNPRAPAPKDESRGPPRRRGFNLAHGTQVQRLHPRRPAFIEPAYPAGAIDGQAQQIARSEPAAEPFPALVADGRNVPYVETHRHATRSTRHFKTWKLSPRHSPKSDSAPWTKKAATPPTPVDRRKSENSQRRPTPCPSKPA